MRWIPFATLISARVFLSRTREIRARPPRRANRESTQPFLFPGSDVAPERPRDRDPEMRTASLQQAAFLKGDGVEMNFEGADVQTVAKTLLGDILQLNFVVDPRVQGNVTLASAGPISRKDVLPAFESVLRMQNAAIVRSGDLVKIVPMPEAGAGGAISVGAGEPGFGVSLVPLRYTSASTVAKTAESFLSRPGAIRVVQSRNVLLIQGTTAERQAALDVVATFDVEWLQNQSVGVYPLKSTSPETMIGELERVFETSEGGLGQGVIRFQPISRMNAVMVVTKNPKLLAQTTQWVRRLDRSDTTGTTLRTFRLKNGKATEVAKILNDIFGQKSGSRRFCHEAIGTGGRKCPGPHRCSRSRLVERKRVERKRGDKRKQQLRQSRRRYDCGSLRVVRQIARTARRTLPVVRPGISRAERSRTCEFQLMRPTIRLWSIPTRRTIGSSNARFAISTGR